MQNKLWYFYLDYQSMGTDIFFYFKRITSKNLNRLNLVNIETIFTHVMCKLLIQVNKKKFVFLMFFLGFDFYQKSLRQQLVSLIISHMLLKSLHSVS